jgi:phage tail sheath protein FI
MPGVQVGELDTRDAFVAAATGVPVVIGAATPSDPATGASSVISSSSEFDAVYDDPSPAMDAAITGFFAAGGDLAVVVASPADDAASLNSALSSLSNVAGWDLLVVPALAQLGGAEWSSLATSMARTAADRRAVALLDPPVDAVAAAATDEGAALAAAAAQLRQTPFAAAAVLYSSALADTKGAPSPTAASGAGVLAAGDRTTGVWSTPGGTAHPIPGLTPALLVDNPLSSTLAAAGLTVVRTVHGYGTVLMGDQDVSYGDDGRELSLVRTLDMIERSIEAGLQPYVFAANDAQTWSQVVAATSAFLQSLWAQGALVGATPPEAYTVTAGMGTTMTPQDVLDGYMVIAVTLQLGDPARPIDLSFTQTMGG